MKFASPIQAPAGQSLALGGNASSQLTLDGSTVTATVPIKMPNVQMSSVSTYGGIWGANLTPDITNYGVLIRNNGSDSYLQGLTSANINVAGVNRIFVDTTAISAYLTVNHPITCWGDGVATGSDIDGSWRKFANAGNLYEQKKISGTWVTQLTLAPKTLTVSNASLGHSAYYTGTDWARFGHSAMDNQNGYGFMQYYDGQVMISAPTAKTLSLSINNVAQVVCDGSYVNIPAGTSLTLGSQATNAPQVNTYTTTTADDSLRLWTPLSTGSINFICGSAGTIRAQGTFTPDAMRVSYTGWTGATYSPSIGSYILHRFTAATGNTLVTLPTGIAIGTVCHIYHGGGTGTLGVQAGTGDTVQNAGGSPHYVTAGHTWSYLKVDTLKWNIIGNS